MGNEFNEDIYVEAEIRNLCNKFGIKTIIETGTYMGKTTPIFAQLAPKVHTIEINPSYYEEVSFIEPNIQKHLGNSPEVLQVILPWVEKPCLFYLDAHWYDYWPILDELTVIGRWARNSILVIHDFSVPGRTDLQAECYHCQKLDIDYIMPLLPQIYPTGYKYHYNSQSTAIFEGEVIGIGIIYIYPGN